MASKYLIRISKGSEKFSGAKDYSKKEISPFPGGVLLAKTPLFGTGIISP